MLKELLDKYGYRNKEPLIAKLTALDLSSPILTLFHDDVLNRNKEQKVNSSINNLLKSFRRVVETNSSAAKYSAFFL